MGTAFSTNRTVAAARRRCIRTIAYTGILLAAVLHSPARAGVQIDEVLAGANGDSRIQFIELRVCCGEPQLWGPQGDELVGRVRLAFFDARGIQTGEFVFPSDPPIGAEDEFGGRSVLIATSGFAGVAGLPASDFLMPASVLAIAGQVCVQGNPANPNAPSIHLCLSYGPFVGPMQSDTLGTPIGSPADSLPLMGAASLRRTQNFASYDANQLNADFALGAAAPRNSAGNTGSFAVSSLVAQGETLFLQEQFLGNGRTCGTCHRPEDQFSISPEFVATLPAEDALFIAETNPSLMELENACLVRSPRAMILANVDGFAQPSVFRGAPHLINIAATAPYGQSGETPTLTQFTTAAVRQHFPKTLARNEDPSAGPTDFRLPTTPELTAIEAFMQSLVVPSDGDLSLDRMLCASVHAGADAAAVQRGRDLFFGAAKCSLCHGGPLFFEADPSIGGGLSFNTGVAVQFINEFDACVGGPLLYPDSSTRAFNTPTLIDVKNTSPYFHDNSAATLKDAIRFYNGLEFNESPGGTLVGGIALPPAHVNDLAAFLEALVEPQDCAVDTTPPALTCPGTVNANAEPGVCQASVSVPPPVVSDNCCLKSVTNSVTGTENASGSYACGVTTVNWTATDFRGNSVKCSHTVDVACDDCCAGGGTGNCNQPVVSVALRAVPPGQPSSPEQRPLPDGITTVCPGNDFLLEIWVSEVDGGKNFGVRRGYIDVLFNRDVVRGQLPIDHGSIYTLIPHGSINNNTGVLNDIGGATNTQQLSVSPNWGLLGRVRMAALGVGDAPFTMQYRGANAFALGGQLDPLSNVRVDISNTLMMQVTDGTPPQLTGCPDDVSVACDHPDGLGTVDFSPPSAADTCDASPTVECRDSQGGLVASGQRVADGTTITCRATDSFGNVSACPAFHVDVIGTCPCAADETIVDCNNNGTPDSCEIAHATAADCNGNGVPDECDISSGPSEDCNADGRPDECGVLASCEVVGLTATDQAAGDRFGSSVSLSGELALMGARLDRCANNASNCGSAYIFRRGVSGWAQEKKLVASDAAAEDLFGWGTGLDGDRAVIGARLHNTPAGLDAGQAYIYRESAGQWTEEAKLRGTPAAAGDQFGTAAAISGLTVVVGAPFADCTDSPGSDCGRAYPFNFDGAQWVQASPLAPADLASNDQFGTEVAIDGDLCVVSSPYDDCDGGTADCGSVYVFHRSGGTWSQEAKLLASDGTAGDNFGISVSLRRGILVVGAYGDSCPGGGSDCGSAYIFRRSNGVWTEEKKLRANDAALFDSFGTSVATDGEQVLVGSRLDDCVDGTLNCGSAYVFRRTGGVWGQVAKMTASDATEDDLYGVSVGLDAGTAILGAYNHDCKNGGVRCGAVYIAVLAGDDCDCDAQPDQCEYRDLDFDEDGLLDPCDGDVDGDGIINALDACDFTPTGLTGTAAGADGTAGTEYCQGELRQYRDLCQCLALTPHQIGVWHPWCVEVFDANGDGGVNLRDFAAYQASYQHPPQGQ